MCPMRGADNRTGEAYVHVRRTSEGGRNEAAGAFLFGDLEREIPLQ